MTFALPALCSFNQLAPGSFLYIPRFNLLVRSHLLRNGPHAQTHFSSSDRAGSFYRTLLLLRIPAEKFQSEAMSMMILPTNLPDP